MGDCRCDVIRIQTIIAEPDIAPGLPRQAVKRVFSPLGGLFSKDRE
jgi:hypothetical protein